MSNHLSPLEFSRLADGELTRDELATAQQHLATCPGCTSQALQESLFKRAVLRAGHRYAPPPELAERVNKRASTGVPPTTAPAERTARRVAFAGWGAAAAVFLATILLWLYQGRVSASPLVAEVADMHIATLAANQPPQVVSSDRHTVKPWFQGKLPFSFNLPASLPADVVLEGANLTYLGNQPVAQLVYSVGHHRASVFLRQQRGTETTLHGEIGYSGFHVVAFGANGLDAIAISDVEPSRLTELARLVEQAQSSPAHP